MRVTNFVRSLTAVMTGLPRFRSHATFIGLNLDDEVWDATVFTKRHARSRGWHGEVSQNPRNGFGHSGLPRTPREPNFR